jgi:hypothetical protein
MAIILFFDETPENGSLSMTTKSDVIFYNLKLIWDDYDKKIADFLADNNELTGIVQAGRFIGYVQMSLDHNEAVMMLVDSLHEDSDFAIKAIDEGLPTESIRYNFRTLYKIMKSTPSSHNHYEIILGSPF